MLHFEQKLFAHRGLHGSHHICPENSLPAFQAAVDQGFGIELDIQFSKDKQIVVFHDNTLRRVCGIDGRVCDYTLEELQQFTLYDSPEHIPLFTQVLDLVDGRVPLIVEFKADGLILTDKLCRAAAEILDHYDGEYCIESFHPHTLYWFRRHRPLVKRGQLCTDFFHTHAKGRRWQFVLLESQITNLLTKPDFVAYDRRFPNHLAFRFWRRFTTPVGWTYRSAEQIREDRNRYEYFIFEKKVSSD